MPNHSEMMATVVATLERITKTIESIEDRQQAVKELQKPPLLVTLTALADEEAEKPNMSALDESALTDVVVEVTDDFAVVQSDSTLINPMELESVVDVVAESSDDDFSLDVNPYLDPEKSTLIAVTNTVTEVTFEKIPITFLPVRVSAMTEIGQVDKESGFKFPVGKLSINISFCILAVCENASMIVPSIFMKNIAFFGSWCCIKTFQGDALSLNPPKKPPDIFLNALQVLKQSGVADISSVWMLNNSGIREWICENQFSAVDGETGLLTVCKNVYNKFSAYSVVLHQLNDIQDISRLLNDVPFSIFPGYLHLCISYVCENALQTFFPSSDVQWTSITSHTISCRSNDVQIIRSWVGKPFWLPTDDIGYFIVWHGWLTKVGNFVLECLDMADFTLLLKQDELIPSDFAHKIKGRQRAPCLRALSGFEVFLIVLDPVTRRLNLNPIYKHVMVHVMWVAGAYEEKLYIQVVVALCPGALLNRMTAKNIYREHAVAAIYGVILNTLHFCRHLVVRHTDIEMENYLVSNTVEDILLEATDFGEPLFIEDVLIVDGCVGYFKVDSTKVDQPMNKVWPATVRFKGFAKFSFNKDSTKPHNIIIIEETTEGTSSSTFSFSLQFINVYQLMLAWYLRFLQFYVLLWIEENVHWLNVWELLDLAWCSPKRLETETYVLGDLDDVRLVSLNMGSLAAAATYRGHFEDILRAMLKEVEEIDDKMILFIYEIQLILSARRRIVIPLMERHPDLVLGEDLLDEENVNNMSLEWLRRQHGLVTQEPVLLSLRIRDNIVYGKLHATLNQIEGASLWRIEGLSNLVDPKVEDDLIFGTPVLHFVFLPAQQDLNYSGTINGNSLKVCGTFTVLLSDAAWDYVLNHCDPTYDTGAWPIGRWLEKMLLERLLQYDTLATSIVLVDLAFGGNGFSYHVEKNGEHVYAGGKINYLQLQYREMPLHMSRRWEDQLLVQWGKHPPDAQTWKIIASIPTFDLEDKVAFERVSNVTVIRRTTGTTRPTAGSRHAPEGTTKLADGATDEIRRSKVADGATDGIRRITRTAVRSR